MTMEDMTVIRGVTPFVTGTTVALGGSGDPSEMTAHGVLHGIRAVAEEAGLGDLRASGLAGLTVAVQGVGKVGAALAALLRRRGARVIVADLDRRRAGKVAAEVGAEVASHERIHRTACDVFAPCALGGVLNRSTIGQLRCRAVAGSANNQLLTVEDGDRLHRRGILYAPDYVINAGGLINIAVGLEPAGYDRARAARRAALIYRNLKAVFRLARERGWTPACAADRLAERRWREGRAWRGPEPIGAGSRRAIG
jgi:leucine dehydrogenase